MHSGRSRQRVLFVTTGLGVGGAERALESLMPRLLERDLEVAVVSLRETQPVGMSMRAMGVSVTDLGMGPSEPSPAGYARLLTAVRHFKPNILHGWMYHGNVAAHFGRVASPRARVLGTVHQTLARLDLESPVTRAVIRTDAALSHAADRIIYVAQSAAAQHVANGYSKKNGVVIPNGIDTTHFSRLSMERDSIHAELGIPVQSHVIGMIGRLHPSKNHRGFLRAARALACRRQDVHFVVVGSGVTAAESSLAALASAPELAGRLHLLGPRNDVARVLSGFDLYVLSSIQEALPNVVSEAMACEVPCIVSDVGDAGWMVGDTGWVVPPSEDFMLAEAMDAALNEGDQALMTRGAKARQRVQGELSIEQMTSRYVDLYRSLR